MIRIYSYYNFGGFKDLYLGTFDDSDEFKYFIPLLPVYEERIKDNPDDTKLSDKLSLWKSLPHIVELYEGAPDSYPKEAARSMSHAGYKILYQQFKECYRQISIRDISGMKDEYGRTTIFNLMFVSDDVEDVSDMDILADYIRKNLKSFEIFCQSLFEMDFIVNALKFNFSKMTNELRRILTEHKISSEDYPKDKQVILLVIPDSVKPEISLRELDISAEKVSSLYRVNGEKIRMAQPKVGGFRNDTFHEEYFYKKRIEELEKRVAELEKIVELIIDMIQ